LQPLGKLLHIPKHSEILLIIGLLGGYPVGAQCIQQAYDSGALSRTDAQRMLRFCNNAGPAFLFGFGGHLFRNWTICFILWIIHILGALMIGIITPGEESTSNTTLPLVSISFTDSVRRSTTLIISVCSWIVLFRVLLSFLWKWVLHFCPVSASVLSSGLLELTNGCAMLAQLKNPAQQFVLFSTLIGFGGFCVALQTSAVLAGSDLSMRPYLLAKAAHSAISYILSFFVSISLPGKINTQAGMIMAVLSTFIIFLYILSCRKSKRGIAFRRKTRYNIDKTPGGITYEAIP
jgi:hypothetical protein